jgi:Mg2+ and Co2+ transporter CorA
MLQILEFTADSLRFVEDFPAQAPSDGFVWVFCDRAHFQASLPALQAAAQRLGGSPLLDLHCKDLANPAHPSHYDFTSVYDLLIFRRLAGEGETGVEPGAPGAEPNTPDGNGDPAEPARMPDLKAFGRIRTRAVGFVAFDRFLISVHPDGCTTARTFIERFIADARQAVDASGARSRTPTTPADLVLRMVNTLVDSYLDLRKALTSQLERWQAQLLRSGNDFQDWHVLLAARSRLHVLEDLCEEQHDAVQEWLDSLREQPLAAFGPEPSLAQATRDHLVARARDVVEHIERVAHHARRLEQSAETAVQMHFSAQSHRTNAIMRTLTAITAVFLPLNLITGFFGMNFEFLPLIHSSNGLWLAVGLMATIATGLLVVFWRKRYLARTGR